MTKYYWLAIIILITACDSYTTDVKNALDSAGGNRTDIEQVLSHFKKQGRTPYKAACFIIANMPYHQSHSITSVDPSYEEFFRQTDSLYHELFGSMSPEEVLSYNSKEYDALRKELAQTFSHLPISTQQKSHQADIQTISADFLIKNIEQALELWETHPRLKKLSFDQFKEWILPYRTTDEELMVDKQTMHTLYQKILLPSNQTLPITKTVERYKAYIDKCRWINRNTTPQAHAGIYDLYMPKFKNDCHNIASWTADIFRSCGIPIVYEYTPQWQDRTKRHFWCATPDSTGIFLPFTPPDNNLMEDWQTDMKYAGKVYRRTFGANKNTPYFLSKESEAIPEELSSPLISDQTHRYHQTITLYLPFEEETENNLAYLCFFAREEEGLTPVAWGEIDKKKGYVVFEQVPLNIQFFPAYYQRGELVPFASPFMLQTNSVIDWIPTPHSKTDKQKSQEYKAELKAGKLFKKGSAKEIQDIRYHTFVENEPRQNITLLRKYPDKRTLRAMREKLKDAVIIASDNERGPYDTLYRFGSVPQPYLQEILFDNAQPYRYYRFATKDKSPVNIAHIEFLAEQSNKHTCTPATPLPVFSQKSEGAHSTHLWRIEGIPLKTGSNPSVAFDNNMETFAGSSTVGLDFTHPIRIEGIRFTPRNANNMIVPGDTYELLYYDNGWQPLSRKEATANFLTFEDVPAGVLFWLRNLSHGREEHPFIYHNQKQLFINIDTPENQTF